MNLLAVQQFVGDALHAPRGPSYPVCACVALPLVFSRRLCCRLRLQDSQLLLQHSDPGCFRNILLFHNSKLGLRGRQNMRRWRRRTGWRKGKKEIIDPPGPMTRVDLLNRHEIVFSRHHPLPQPLQQPTASREKPW